MANYLHNCANDGFVSPQRGFIHRFQMELMSHSSSLVLTLHADLTKKSDMYL